MKKIIALLIFVCAGAALFAQSVRLSVGGGANFTANFTSYTLNSEYKDAIKAYNDSIAEMASMGIDTSSIPKMSDNYNSTLTGFGIYGFFDATYVEANLGVLFGT